MGGEQLPKATQPPSSMSASAYELFQKIAPLGTGTFAHRELWTTLAHIDLKNRYRGSLLGPFWLTLATGVLIGGIGLLYGGLFGHPLSLYLPYVAVSIVIWTFIATTLTEASNLFLGEGIVLKQLPVPASLFITRLIYRNILVLAHNAIIMAIVLVAFPQSWHLSLLALPFGLAILILNLWWLAVVISIVSARFRDIPPIVASLLQILFFLTPVIWRKEDLPGRAILVDLNPFYHLIEIIGRRSLVRQFPPSASWSAPSRRFSGRSSHSMCASGPQHGSSTGFERPACDAPETPPPLAKR